MTTAATYAKALFELAEAHPEKSSQYLKNLRESLKKRGHEKLLNRIWNEYKKLAIGKERTKLHRRTTTEMERTDKLLQLYKTLISQ